MRRVFFFSFDFSLFLSIWNRALCMLTNKVKVEPPLPPSLRIAPLTPRDRIGIHGGRARLGRRADRDVHHLEQGEQMGLH